MLEYQYVVITFVEDTWLIPSTSLDIFLGTLRLRKKIAHQLPHLIFTPPKQFDAPRQILSLGKHVKCMNFSDDMVFSLALVIFSFFF